MGCKYHWPARTSTQRSFFFSEERQIWAVMFGTLELPVVLPPTADTGTNVGLNTADDRNPA